MASLTEGLTKETRKNLFGNADLNMLWTCAADPRFPYWVHVPDSFYEEENPHYQLMVIIHGTACATEDYVQRAKKWADEHNVAILAPLFPSGVVVKDDFNAYKMIRQDGIYYDQILLAMVDEMKARYEGCIETDKFFLFGHSGGGQYVHRFMYLHPERIKAINIGAPGRPTYLDPEEDFYWGIKNFKQVFGQELDLPAIRKVPVIIAVGERDNLFIGDSKYGNNRVDRMKTLQQNYLDNGVETVELAIIPGIAHEDGNQERIETATKFFEKFL